MAYGDYPAYRVRRQRRHRPLRLEWRLIPLILFGAGLGALSFGLVAATAALTVTVAVQGSERILPGVTAAGEPLGGLTPQEATQVLEVAWQGNEATVALSDGERLWPASPAAWGFAIDAQATAERARRVGRGKSLLDEMAEIYVATVRTYAVMPVVTLEAQVARAALEAHAETFSVPPQDATLRFEGGQVIAVAGVAGRSLDVEATLAAWAADPALLLQSGTLPLVMRPVAPRIADASGAVAEAQALLATPLAVRAYDPISDTYTEWMVTPEEIATWLAVETDGETLRVTVDAQRVQAYLATREAELGGGRTLDREHSTEALLAALREHTPATLIVIHPPTTYTVQPGDTLIRIAWQLGMPMWRILEANPGLNPDALTVGQALNIPSKSDLLPLPVVPNKRLVVSIDQQRLWVYENGELLHEFVISTGIDRSPTQPGVFQVQTHEPNAYASVWDLWMPYFLGIYEAWPGFMNGFHGLPSRNGGQILWANSLGRRTSFGCIILDLPDAEWLYNWAEDGVVVEIVE